MTDLTDGGREVDDNDDGMPSDVQMAIAEQIVSLAEIADTPTEFEPAGRTLRLEDVDFRSAGWMVSLAEVQGWLRLSEDLVLDDRETFLTTLARVLEFDNADEALQVVDGQRELNSAGLDRLLGRLQHAVRLQDDFQANLEADGGTRESATGIWIEAWEEDDSFDEESTGPVQAKAGLWAIHDFSHRASTGKLNLSPSYQRGDVWPTSDAQMLIESILRGIPLPSLIILKTDTGAAYEVVDGKQRLTSILRFIGKHPRALERIREAEAEFEGQNFKELFNTDYPKFRRKWKNVVGEQLTTTREREYCFPFRLRSGSAALRGELSVLEGKYFTDIRDEVIRVADDEVPVGDIFEQTTEYKIPLIEYSKATRRQIHEVFNLYNKQGKHLNAEEIRNALYHDVDFMRGLLVAAGDNEDVAIVAPFLEPIWDDLSRLPKILEDYSFGTARYRRTKVLSWLAAMLLVDSMDSGRPKRLSTSRHIDSLLERIEGNSTDPLRSAQTIREAFSLMHLGLEAHSGVDEAWSPKFRDTKNGVKWQELQLIASGLGVCLAAVVLGDGATDRLEEAAGSIHDKSNSNPQWKRPEKTQTATQWKYIAEVALRILDELQVDPDEVSDGLISKFGHSCVPTLKAVADDNAAS